MNLPRVMLVTRQQRIPSFSGQWIYFGADYADMLRWERSLPNGKRISYAGRLAETFRRLRPDLIRWAANMGAASGPTLDWWMTSIAGKNVFATPIFLHLCYLDIIAQIMPEQREEILIVCEDECLLETIKRLLFAAGHLPVRTGMWPMYLATYYLLEAARWAFRWAKGIGGLALELAAARLTRHPGPSHKSTLHAKQALIHTCIDDDCFGPDGKFRDRYFDGLADWLRGKGYHVAVLPWVYNTRRGVFDRFRWFRSSPEVFVLAEDYLRIADYFDCGRQLLRCGRTLSGRHQFGRCDVTPLVVRERRVSSSSAQYLRFFLYGPALARWLADGNRCALFVDMFENSAPERPQIACLRKLSPGTLLVGYQHGAVTMGDWLSYAIDPDEWQQGLFPDRIVCSGELTARLLTRDGYPPAHVVAGPALRYRYLLETPQGARSANSTGGNQPGLMLVVLSLMIPAAVEALHRLIPLCEFFAQHSLEVVLRVHPMMNRAALLNACGMQSLPAGWKWSGEPLRDQLARAKIVIGFGTAAQVDAAASGVPVVAIKRELGFDYNFLDYWSDIHPMCRPVAPGDLPARLSEIIEDHDGRVRIQAAALAADIMAGLGKFDDAHFSAFI